MCNPCKIEAIHNRRNLYEIDTIHAHFIWNRRNPCEIGLQNWCNPLAIGKLHTKYAYSVHNPCEIGVIYAISEQSTHNQLNPISMCNPRSIGTIHAQTMRHFYKRLPPRISSLFDIHQQVGLTKYNYLLVSGLRQMRCEIDFFIKSF